MAETTTTTTPATEELWIDHNGKAWNPSVDFSFKGYKLYGAGSYSSQPQELKDRYNAYKEWRRNGGSSTRANKLDEFEKKYADVIAPEYLATFKEDIQALRELFKTGNAAESTLMKLFATDEPELGYTVSVELAYFRGPKGERMSQDENLGTFYARVGLPTQKLKDSDVKKLVKDWNADTAHVQIKLEDGKLTYGEKPQKVIVHKNGKKDK